MTAPVLDDLSFQFRDDGVLMNQDSTTMPFIDVTKISGLDSATTRTSFKDTEGEDGGTVEADFESTRIIVIEGVVYAESGEQLDNLLDDLKANFAPSRTYHPFYFKLPGKNARLAYCKCTSGFRNDWDALRRLSTAQFQVTLQAGDPIVYGVDQHEVQITLLKEPPPGFGFPFDFPFGFGDPVTGPGSFTITNNGNRPAPFKVQMFGDFWIPTIRSDTEDKELSIDLSVTGSNVLEVDFGKRTVELNGASRRGEVLSEGWFLLQPGDNSLRFFIEGNPNTGSGSGTVIVTWSDAWR